MRRFVIVCWLVAGSATALILFQIKQEVRDLEQEISRIDRGILRDQEALHVLEAEWSYLNSPARLSALAERHLGMAPIPGARVIGFADLPLPEETDPEEAPQGVTPDTPIGEDTRPANRATLVTAPAGRLRP